MVLIACVLLILTVVLVKTAWVSDDACISFRVVDNFLHGYGLRWNSSERVQTYTNPLMVFCMIVLSFFTKEYYLTAMLFNIFTTLLAVSVLIFGIAQGKCNRFCVSAALLLFSKAFIDYATSGLENSLEYLIFAVFYLLYFKEDEFSRKKLFRMALIACLALLNRMDSILLLLPPLVDLFFLQAGRKWWKNIMPGLLGILPFCVWEMFSLLYYGFLFPNTAYAKLNSGIPLSEYIQQGIIYYLDSFNRDPITLFGIFLALCLIAYVFASSADRKALCAGFGMILYGIYILRIGGDFMSGRFLAIVFFCAAIVFARYGIENRFMMGISACIILWGILLPNNNITSDGNYSNTEISKTGIADERGFYYQSTGLLKTVRIAGEMVVNQHPDVQWAKEEIAAGNKVVVARAVGYLGLEGGANLYIIDPWALGDAFLARCPARYNASWRIGHLERTLPEGYVETIESGENQLADTALAEYYDILQNIISGDLLSGKRIEQIIKMNMGMYDGLIDARKFTQKAEWNMNWEDFSKPVTAGDAWNGRNAWMLDKNGTNISLNAIVHSSTISIFADHNDAYWIQVKRNGEIRYEEKTESVEAEGMQRRTIHMPAEIAQEGYDTVAVIPQGGDGQYSIAYLQCTEEDVNEAEYGGSEDVI